MYYYKIVWNRTKSNHAFLILGPHKKGMIMVPKERPCASIFPMFETGIRLCDQSLPGNLRMQAHSHPGLWWTIYYFTTLLLQAQRVCVASLERNLKHGS